MACFELCFRILRLQTVSSKKITTIPVSNTNSNKPYKTIEKNETGQSLFSLFRCCRSKATAIVKEVMAPQVKKGIHKILKTQPYSVMMDETTDVGTVKQAAIVVRYYDIENGKVETKFYAMEVS